MNMRCCVIICVYTEKRWDDIMSAIASLRSQTRKPDEIIVVVDHNASLAERLAQENVGVHLIVNAFEKGLSGARNCGIASTRCELVAFLDDDAYADPRWLEVLENHFSDPHVLGVGSWVKPLWSREMPVWFPPQYLWIVGCSYEGMPTDVSEVRNLFGGSMIIRRSIFSKIGGFDSRLGRDIGILPLGCEETEFCLRARSENDGCVFLVDPTIGITHRVTHERIKISYFFFRCFAEGVSKWRLSKICSGVVVLNSERKFVTEVLPAGLVKEMRSLARADFTSLLRIFMLIGGVGAAGMGFAFASINGLFNKRHRKPGVTHVEG